MLSSIRVWHVARSSSNICCCRLGAQVAHAFLEDRRPSWPSCTETWPRVSPLRYSVTLSMVAWRQKTTLLWAFSDNDVFRSLPGKAQGMLNTPCISLDLSVSPSLSLISYSICLAFLFSVLWLRQLLSSRLFGGTNGLPRLPKLRSTCHSFVLCTGRKIALTQFKALLSFSLNMFFYHCVLGLFVVLCGRNRRNLVFAKREVWNSPRCAVCASPKSLLVFVRWVGYFMPLGYFCYWIGTLIIRLGAADPERH